MKKFWPFALGALIIVVVLLSAAYWWQKNSRPVSSNQSSQSFVIPKGSSATQIATKLEEQGLIRNKLAFKFYAQLTGQSKKIQAGEYKLSPSYSVQKMVTQLTQGPLELWVTVPEGLRREEIVERFIKGLEKDGTEATTFRTEFMQESQGEEGYLFPDTYLFPRDATAAQVVSKMTSTFDAKIADYQDKIDSSSLTLKQIVTLASIVERESRANSERPEVAGVLLNRLDIGMGLQADATVQYAVASRDCKVGSDCTWWPSVTRADLEIASAYNTYKYRGLPPGPIANPGISSLMAAITPSSNDYLYYLHDADGNIHFAKTLDEHNANVRNYLGK